MKPIMSFWSEPYITNYYNHWINPNSWNLSWILSVESISKIYGKPHLYTDEAGKNFLVDKLGLSFASIDLSLNDLKGKNPKFFSLGRTFAIGMQKEPFIHIDYDTYLFEPVPKDILNKDVFFEKEVLLSSNKLIVQRPDLFDNVKGLPEWWEKIKFLKSYKMGIIGGSNVEYFSRLSQTIFDIINSNAKEKWDEVNKSIKGNFESSFFCPQYTLDEYCSVGLAKNMGISPGFNTAKYAHVHGDKIVSSEFYGRLLKRLVSDYPDTINTIKKIEPAKSVSLPKISVIVIPNSTESVYDSVLRLLIPRKMAPDEVIVSSYNLNEEDRRLLSKIEGVRIVQGSSTYMKSLCSAFRKTNGEVIIVADGHILVPRLYIEKSIAAYLENIDTVFCTASVDFLDKPNNISFGALETDDGIYPDLHIVKDIIFDSPKVQCLYGGLYIFPKEALHYVFDSISNIENFKNISSFLEEKGFNIRCIKNIRVSHNFRISTENIV